MGTWCAQGQAQFLLTAPEAERMVEGIARFEPDGVGTVKWLTQHDWIEKLNLQAHQNARLHQVREPADDLRCCIASLWTHVGSRIARTSPSRASVFTAPRQRAPAWVCAGRVCDGVPGLVRQNQCAHPRAPLHRGLAGDAVSTPEGAPGVCPHGRGPCPPAPLALRRPRIRRSRSCPDPQAKEVDNITTYQLLYHEGAVANLLEICLFHPSALEAIDEDHMIELVDWCQWKARMRREHCWPPSVHAGAATTVRACAPPAVPVPQHASPQGQGV